MNSIRRALFEALAVLFLQRAPAVTAYLFIRQDAKLHLAD
jgi:hypothetical protein